MKKFVAAALVAAASAPVVAVPITLNFTVVGSGGGRPVSTITGQFKYNASSVSSVPAQLTAVSLSIAGYSYSLANVGLSAFNNDGFVLIGGTVDGVDNVAYGGTNDFYLYFNNLNFSDRGFRFATANSPAFYSMSFSNFSIAADAVPEPAMLGLFGMGALGLGLSRRRRAA